jgi:hypothetical protein
MNPSELAKWFAEFHKALKDTDEFNTEEVMAIVLRNVPRTIESKGENPRKLIEEAMKKIGKK